MLIFIYTVFHQSFPVSWCCRFRTRNGIDCITITLSISLLVD